MNLAIKSCTSILFEADKACGFFRNMAVASAYDIAPKNVIVAPLAVGNIPLVGISLPERP